MNRTRTDGTTWSARASAEDCILRIPMAEHRRRVPVVRRIEGVYNNTYASLSAVT